MAEQARGVAVLDHGINARAFRSAKEAQEYRDRTGEDVTEIQVFGPLSMVEEAVGLFPGVSVRQGASDGRVPKKQPENFLYKLLERVQFYLSNYGLRQFWVFMTHMLMRGFHGFMKCFGVDVVYFRWYVGRIGHLAYNTQTFMNSMSKYRRKLLIGLRDDGAANLTLQKMWGRLFTKVMSGDRWRRVFDHVGLRRLKYYRATAWYGDAHVPAQTQDWRRHVYFTDEEIAMGEASLRRMGVPEGAEFVCVHARDPAYLDTIAPGADWSYHDFRDCNIDNFRLAAEYLTTKGLYVIRLSQVAEKPFVVEGNEKVIDYASLYRTDFMDIYLMAKCLFLLGSCSGVAQVSTIFGRPVAMTNWVHCELMTCFREGDLLIPKRHVRYGEEMSLREILDTGAGRLIKGERYVEHGIELIENNPAEILGLAVEMLERVRGRWEWSIQEREMVGKFRSIIDRGGLLCHGSPVMIGWHYAKKNAGWLEG